MQNVEVPQADAKEDAESYNSPLHLIQVHAYFRHGDRTPTPLGEATARAELWESRLQEVPSALKDREYFPQKYPWGLLTTKGADQARTLGAWIREHYLPALCGLPSSDLDQLLLPQEVIHLRSTNFLRTHLTAWFLLEGLLKNVDAVASIPIACREEKDENLYHNEHCPRDVTSVICRLAKRWEEEWRAVREEVGADGMTWHQRYKKMEDVMALGWENSADKTGFLLSMDRPGFPWVSAIDTLECERFHGDILPEGISEENVVEVRGLLARDYALSFQDREVLQLSTGRLVRELVEVMLEGASCSQSSRGPSLFLYSGHDATIMPLSVALGVPWPDWPGYTSSICVELWGSEEGKHFVRVLYAGKAVALPLARAEDAPRKVFVTLEEFHEIAKWSMLSEADFSCKCQEVSGLVMESIPVVALGKL